MQRQQAEQQREESLGLHPSEAHPWAMLASGLHSLSSEAVVAFVWFPAGFLRGQTCVVTAFLCLDEQVLPLLAVRRSSDICACSFAKNTLRVRNLKGGADGTALSSLHLPVP